MIRQKTAKILITLLLVTMFFLGIESKDTYAASQTIQVGKVTATVLNVRASATTSSGIVTQVKKGESFEILGSSGKWYKIKANGKTGWSHGDYLSISNKTVSGQSGDTIQVTTAVLNVRSSSNTSSSILTQVRLNQKFDVLGQSGKWYKISANGKTGWVHSDYTKVVKGTSNPEPPKENPSSDSLIVDTAVLNVRASATTSSSIITQVRKNSKFNILGISGKWYKISANGKTGWVHGDYVKVVKGTTKPDPKPEATDDTLKVDTAVLNLRASATTSSPILTQVRKNQVFNILDRSGKWYKISANGKTGWVHGDYVKVVKGTTKPEPEPEPEPEVKPIPAPEIESLIIDGSGYTTDPHNLKAKASSKNKVLYQFGVRDLDNNEAVVIQEYSEKNTALWTPGRPGHFQYYVRVKDSKDKDEKTNEKVSEITIRSYIFYGTSSYHQSLEEMVDIQMETNPQTDAYGGGWKTAKREDTEKYIDPDNFLQFTPEVKLDGSKVATITADPRLNVRSQASTNGQVLGTVNLGEAYPVLAESRGWLKINFNGQDGWISGSYTELTINYSKLRNIRITTNGLRLREESSTSSPILGQVNKDEVFTILGENKGWYQIKANGKTGWVSGDYAELTNSVPKEMYQFLVLSGSSGIRAQELNAELKGKGILEGKGQAFLDGAEANNINEIYLVSHALLETGNGRSKLANGVLVSEVGGKAVEAKTVYNMFGIGAYDGDAIRLGSEYAYRQGWFTPEAAIIGGAKFIGSSYINNEKYKQDTLYKMKWNPDTPASHQYATDIAWAMKQTSRMDLINHMANRYNSITFRFDIPRYMEY